MPRALSCLVLTAALAAGTWASAGAAGPARPLDTPLQADLDGDGTQESIRARETACRAAGKVTAPPCPRDAGRSFVVEAVDSCRTAGAAALTEKVIALSREMRVISFLRIFDADGDGERRAVAFELRSGASARALQAKVVSFRADADGCLIVRNTLFSYPRAALTAKRPKGTVFHGGELRLRNFSPGLPGLELRTRETFARPSDRGCCPSYRRTTFWRYVPGVAHGYTQYRTKLQKLPRRRPA